MFQKLSSEFLGTFWLVLGGCGSAVLAAAFPALGIGFVGVSLAFGLTVLTGAYALGPISGGHFNPAVTFGLWAGGRFPARSVLAYVIAQVAGAVAAAGVLYLIASGKPGFDLSGGFASNGYGEHSPGGYSLTAALVTEVVMTFMFLIVILGTTHRRAPVGFARARDRPGAHADPPDQHSGDQHVGQSGAQHRAGALRGRLGALATLALLARADRGRPRRGLDLSRRSRSGTGARHRGTKKRRELMGTDSDESRRARLSGCPSNGITRA